MISWRQRYWCTPENLFKNYNYDQREEILDQVRAEGGMAEEAFLACVVKREIMDQTRAEGGKAQEAFLACVVKHTPNPLKRFSLHYIADFLIKQKWKGLSSMWAGYWCLAPSLLPLGDMPK